MTRPDPQPDPVTGVDAAAAGLDGFRTSLDAWLDDHAGALAPGFDGAGTLDQQMAQLAKVKRLAFDAGWMRSGWPERVGGLGGSTLTRAYLGEALTARDLVEPGLYSMTEVLAPTMIDYAAPELAAAMVPALLRGDETWCQGFSEPGHREQPRLARLSGRADRRGTGGSPARRSGRAWRSTPQRCVAAHPNRHARVGPPGDHGPLRGHGLPRHHRASDRHHARQPRSSPRSSSTTSLVPLSRTLGDVGGGWAVAMDLLPYERSTSLWHRAAFLHRRLQELLEAAPPGVARPGQARRGHPAPLRLPGPLPGDPAPDGGRRASRSGDLHRQGAARHRGAGGVRPGRRRPGPRAHHRGRSGRASGGAREYLYSRAASIYGGSAEIQRNIIARRLLDLGDDR